MSLMVSSPFLCRTLHAGQSLSGDGVLYEHIILNIYEHFFLKEKGRFCLFLSLPSVRAKEIENSSQHFLSQW